MSEQASQACSPAVASGRKNKDSENGRFHETVTAFLLETLQDDANFCHWGDDRIGRELGSLIFEFRNGVCQQYLVHRAKKWLQENIFSPYNLLREMDRAGGTLGYAGVEILRLLETKGKKWVKGTMIPSTKALKNAAAEAEKVGHACCPFELGYTARGGHESAAFVPIEQTVSTILDAYSLKEIAKEQTIEITGSLDGAMITKNRRHLTGGLKISDRCARCPFTKELILDDPDNLKAQSRNLCFPLKVCITNRFFHFGILIAKHCTISHLLCFFGRDMYGTGKQGKP